MYGVGLIALLVFGRLKLGERLHRRQIAGVVAVLAGTLAIGLAELGEAAPSLFRASRTRLLVVAVIWLAAAPAAAFLVRGRRIVVQEMLFGIAGGGLAALDAVAKGLAQAGADASSFLPTTSVSWIIFGLSFLGAGGAFAMIQWSYLRSCRASMMGSAYDVAYVALPLFLVPYLAGAPAVGLWCVVGIFLLAAGALLVATPPTRAAATGAVPPVPDARPSTQTGSGRPPRGR